MSLYFGAARVFGKIEHRNGVAFVQAIGEAAEQGGKLDNFIFLRGETNHRGSEVGEVVRVGVALSGCRLSIDPSLTKIDDRSLRG